MCSMFSVRVSIVKGYLACSNYTNSLLIAKGFTMGAGGGGGGVIFSG